MEIILKPKGKIGIMIEAEVIRPDVMYQKKKEEIENLSVWQGPEQMPLGDFFDVEVAGNGSLEEPSIFIQGDVTRVKRIGQGLKTGKIEIQGSAGMHVGSGMTGGSILVHGDVGSWAGMEMKGGLLHIHGNAGDHVGSAYRGSWSGMSGGKIIIEGNARNQLGSGLTGGEIAVAGNVENFAGIRQSGGLILVRGDAVRGVGAEMTGGTIAVCGRIRQFSPGFIEVSREENPKLGETRAEGKFIKFSGDYAISKNPKGSLYYREV
ncbi:MAG: formylmethanofuran dehydrogenase subunit C [Methanotrichaceae archaeon]